MGSPSNPGAVNIPWLWMLVVSGRLFVRLTWTGRPARARIVGAGTTPLMAQTGVSFPGSIRVVAGAAVSVYTSVTPSGEVGTRVGGIRSGSWNGGGGGVLRAPRGRTGPAGPDRGAPGPS